jgi:hypothetical protein
MNAAECYFYLMEQSIDVIFLMNVAIHMRNNDKIFL